MPVRRLNKDQFVDLFRSVLPESYTAPLESEDDAAGLDIVYAFGAMLELADCASNKGSQSQYLREHSAQTDVPASGAVKAQGTLLCSRQTVFLGDVEVRAGTLVECYRLDSFGEEQIVGYYVTTETVTLPEGSSAQVSVLVEAQYVGYAGNIPDNGALFRFATVGRSDVKATFTFDSGTESTFEWDSGAIPQLDKFSPDLRWMYFTIEPAVGYTFVSDCVTLRRFIYINSPWGADVQPPLDVSDLDNKCTLHSYELRDLISLNQSGAIVGGLGGSLDDRGVEMRVFRYDWESDAAYATRLEYVADAVSLPAVRRAVDAVLGPTGVAWRVLETGDATTLAGMVWDFHPYDFGSISHGDGFGVLDLAQGAVWLSTAQAKRCFVVAVSATIMTHPYLASKVWNRVNDIRALGVVFKLVIDPAL